VPRQSPPRRQFLFRLPDVGKPKAEVAAAFINSRVKGCTVTPHFGAIQDKSLGFYEQFPLIICGLDSIKARRWMNSMVVSATNSRQ
jgi:ubiquitin-activating enzyme E1 C